MKTIGLVLMLAGLLLAGYNLISGETVTNLAASVTEQPVPVVAQQAQQEILTLPDQVAKTGIIDYKEIDGERWIGIRENKVGAESTWISCDMALSGSVALPEPSIWHIETYCNE